MLQGYKASKQVLKGTLPADRYLACRQVPCLQAHQAAAQGDLQALQAAWQQAGYSWHAHAWVTAAGQSPDPNNPLTQTWAMRLCAAAAAGGNLALLQWLYQNSCPWDWVTCSCAALGGHLAVLQWARQNGCNWNEDTCACAAAGGHLAVLKWAHRNNCPWSGITTLYAALNLDLVTLKWARQQQPPLSMVEP